MSKHYVARWTTGVGEEKGRKDRERQENDSERGIQRKGEVRREGRGEGEGEGEEESEG